jgi:excisionase family DNA binding protein
MFNGQFSNVTILRSLIAPSSPPSDTPSQEPPRLLTARDAAKALAVCQKTLWSLTEAGEIPAVRIGRGVRYDPHDLFRWIDARKSVAK